MAQRFEITAIVAQEICRIDVLLNVSRGQFKESHFPRSLKFYNHLSTDANESNSWGPTRGHTRLGLDFGIVNGWGGPGARTLLSRQRWWAELGLQNSAALSALCAVRAIDIASLRNKLDPANRLEAAVDQVCRMG